MTTPPLPRTAKIYQFPIRSRTVALPVHRDMIWAFAARTEAPPSVDCGSGWYHQAAVDEAQRGRK